MINSRILKFRAWNKNVNSFVYLILEQSHIRLPAMEMENLLVWQQFTELLDKNGVEIYEGDVVVNYWIVDDDDAKIAVSYGIQEVDAFEGMGWNLWSFYDEEANGKRLSRSVEVIGNIYENPELLDAQRR